MSKKRRRRRPRNQPRRMIDPRHHASTIGSSSDPAFKAGDVIVRLEAARLDPRDQLPRLIFWAPLPWLLYLDFAAERALKAERLRRTVTANLRDRSDGTREPPPALQTKVLDAIAQEAASILFSFAAIEAFANQGLWQKGSDHRFEIRRKGIVHLASPDELERTGKLRDKLKWHLPTTIEKPQLPGRAYADFIRLERMRNAIAHMKVLDRWGDAAPEVERALGLLLRGTVQAPRVAAEVLEHFVVDAVPPEMAERIEALPAHRRGEPEP